MTEITLRETNAVAERSIMSVAEVAARVNVVQEIMEKVMKENTHYGQIPGCGSKPVLLKPGADILAVTFRLVPKYEVMRNDLENGHREFDVTCSMYNHLGELLGQGVGSASTMEKKYRYRWEGRGEDREQVENDNIADVYNTVLKMAKKRAHVDATLTVTGAADIFTQDLIEEDDLPQKPSPAMPKRKSEAEPEEAEPEQEAPKTKTKAKPKKAEVEEEVLSGVIKATAAKTTQTGKTRYGVCIILDSGGEQWTNTFSKSLFEDAESLKGQQALLYVKKTSYGYDLVGVGQEAQGDA